MEDIWQDKTAWIKGFWDWTPETWAAVGFTPKGRMNTIVRESSDPFIMVGYVTLSAKTKNKDLRGKIIGFYLVTHQQGHRDEFTHASQHSIEPESWQYSLRAIRAFTFLPEYRIDVYEFDQTLSKGAQGKAANGVKLTAEQIGRLKNLPYIEVPVYDGEIPFDTAYHIPQAMINKVKGGPQNRSGYIVEGEPVDTEKELYILILKGGALPFLGDLASELQVYKIGLSTSPKTRLSLFQKAMPETIPRGTIEWALHRSTRLDGHKPYPSFDAALKGENAMKEYLSRNSRFLGNEFYAATETQIDIAWQEGRKAALEYLKKDGEYK